MQLCNQSAAIMTYTQWPIKYQCPAAHQPSRMRNDVTYNDVTSPIALKLRLFSATVSLQRSHVYLCTLHALHFDYPPVWGVFIVESSWPHLGSVYVPCMYSNIHITYICVTGRMKAKAVCKRCGPVGPFQNGLKTPAVCKPPEISGRWKTAVGKRPRQFQNGLVSFQTVWRGTYNSLWI